MLSSLASQERSERKSEIKEESSPAEPKKKEYNPYIHGTSSAFFALSSKTNHSLISPVEMIEKFHLAPPGGEISGGGLLFINDRCLPSFGRLRTEVDIFKYDLDKVIKYAQRSSINLNDEDEALEDLKSAIKSSASLGFSNINVILVYALRAIQLGLDIHDIIEKFLSQLNAGIQCYYLMSLLGKFIFPDEESIQLLDEKERYHHTAAISTYLTFEKLTQRIQESQLDIISIVKNPTPDNLNKILDLLTLPKTVIIRESLWGKEKIEVTLFHPRLFSTKVLPNEQILHYNIVKEIADGFLLNDSAGGIHWLLNQYVEKAFEHDFLVSLAQYIQPQIEILQNRFILFRDLCKEKAKLKYSHAERYFLKNSFPLILVSDREENMVSPPHNSHQEFRSLTPVVIGKDIRIIATDNEEHRLMVMKFLEENAIKNVQIVLFEDLYKSRLSGEPPQSPYFADNGEESLAWRLMKARGDTEQISLPDKILKNVSKDRIEWLFNQAKAYIKIKFAEPERPQQATGFLNRIGRGIKNFLSSPSIWVGTAVGAGCFAGGVSAPMAFGYFAATSVGAKAFQAVRRWFAKRAYNRLNSEEGFVAINDNSATIYTSNETFRDGFNQGVKAEQSWYAYASSSYLTYFGTRTPYGQGFQVGRHVEAQREERANRPRARR